MTSGIQLLILALMAGMIRAAPTDDHEGQISSSSGDEPHIDTQYCVLRFGDDPKLYEECRRP